MAKVTTQKAASTKSKKPYSKPDSAGKEGAKQTAEGEGKSTGHKAKSSNEEVAIPTNVRTNTGRGGNTRGLSKGKKRAQEGKPKRPLSAYMIFAMDMRKELSPEDRKLSVAELGKLFGKKWGEMDEQARVPYTERAAEAKEKYREEMINFERATGS